MTFNIICHVLDIVLYISNLICAVQLFWLSERLRTYSTTCIYVSIPVLHTSTISQEKESLMIPIHQGVNKYLEANLQISVKGFAIAKHGIMLERTHF